MKIRFKSEAHEKFFDECMEKIGSRSQYPEYQALFYCLGISEDCRDNIDQIYDFKERLVKPEGLLHKGFVTGTDRRIIRLAFNLYNGGCPTAFFLEGEDKIDELLECTPCSIFSYGGVGQYLIEAIRLRFEID